MQNKLYCQEMFRVYLVKLVMRLVFLTNHTRKKCYNATNYGLILSLTLFINP